MNGTVLTESLYFNDEVVACLVTSLVSRRPLSECLFWLWELHSSIDTLLDGVCVIYLLFYTSASITLEKYIGTKLRSYRSGDNILDLACIIANLRVTKPDPLAYLIHYYFVNAEDQPPTHILRHAGDLPPGVDQKFRPLWGALCAKSPRNIGYYLRVAVRRCGYTVVKETLGAHSQWQSPSYVPMFSGEDSCSLAALCARFVRKHPCVRKDVIQPIPKARVADIAHLFEPRTESLIKRLQRTRAYQIYSPLLPGNYDRLALGSDDLPGHVAESWYVWVSESRLWSVRARACPLKDNFSLVRDDLLTLKNPVGTSSLELYDSPEAFCQDALDSWLASRSSSLKIGCEGAGVDCGQHPHSDSRLVISSLNNLSISA